MLFERAAQLYQMLGDARGEAESLFCLGVFHQVVQGDNDAAAPALNGPTRLIAALRTMSRALQELLTAQARASGLPLLEFLVLIRAAEGDGVTARDAGRELHLNTSTTTGLTGRLGPRPADRTR